MGNLPTTIRQLAASPTAGIFAAAEFKRFVHVYDLQTRDRLQTLDTILDFGGQRLAISDDGKTLIAGAYHIYGIAAYSVASGSELWRRKDLKKVQHITFNSDSSRILCCFECGPCESLNVLNGTSALSLRGVRGIWESPYGPLRFLERWPNYAIADFEGPLISITRSGFAVLSAALSPSLLCISEADGLMRAFDASSGAEVWSFAPPKGAHYVRISFCQSIQSFVGVLWSFEKGSMLHLAAFSSKDGKPRTITDVNQAVQVEFCLRGERLVTSTGDMLDVASGRHLATLPFPLAKASRLADLGGTDATA